MRQQFVDAAVKVREQPREHVPQVGVGVEAIQTRRVNQAHHHGRALTGEYASGKQPVLAAQGSPSEGVRCRGGSTPAPNVGAGRCCVRHIGAAQQVLVAFLFEVGGDRVAQPILFSINPLQSVFDQQLEVAERAIVERVDPKHRTQNLGDSLGPIWRIYDGPDLHLAKTLTS